jgi:hypothetical protein
MASRSAGGPAGHGDDEQVAQVTDRLFAGPLDSFVALRREIAVALKARGDAAGGRRVAAMAKPSRTAWALNQVARRRPEVVKAALDAHAKAQAIQADGDADAMRATARLYRERVAAVVETAEEFSRGDGGGSGLTPAQGRRIGATLQAIAGGGDPALRDALEKGRLVTDVDDEEPFAGLEVDGTGSRRYEGASRPRPEVAPSSTHEARTKSDAEAVAARARAAQRDAERERHARAQEREKKRARLAALEAEVKEARASAREAEVVAARAQSDAERARRAVEALEKRIDEARRDLRAVDG